MHTSDMKVSASDLGKYTRAMIDLLQDPGIYCYPRAQVAVTDIRKVCLLDSKIMHTYNDNNIFSILISMSPTLKKCGAYWFQFVQKYLKTNLV